jgi:diguanylate cyclase (GGDEF)-like protein/PAS domain S-box-containing protein
VTVTTRRNQDRNDFAVLRSNGAQTSDDARRLPENGPGWLGQVVSNSSDVIGVLEEDGTVRHVSPSVRAVLGYRPEEVVGTGVFDYVHPDDVERALGALAETLATPGVLPPVEFRARRADGAWRHVEVVRNNFLGDRSLAGVVINVRDVTERVRVEEELRALQREYEELLGSVEAIIWKGEAQTLRFTFVSDQAEVILGYPARCWTEEPSFWPDHIHPEDREWAVSFCREAVDEKRDHDFEYRMISSDGSVVWLRDIVRVGVEDGIPAQLFGVMVDITERKEAEKAVEQLGHRNQLILDSAGEGIYGLDREDRTTFVNPAAAALTGYTVGELVGKSQHDVVHHSRADGSPYPRQECPIYATLTDGKVHHVEDEVFWRKDGTSFPVEYTSTPILEDGAVVGAVVTFTDVTGRKRAEAAHKEAEERYRTLVERIPAVTYVQQATASGAVTYVSPQMRDLLGYEPEECTSNPEHWLKIIHPEDLGRVLAGDRRANETGERFSMEYRQFAKDGRVVWVRDEATLVRDGKGEPLYWLGVQTDVTKHRLTEARLRESEERFRRSFDDAAIGMALVATDGRFLQANRSLCEIVGYTEEELLGKSFQDITHPEDLDKDLGQARRLLEGEISSYQMEKRYLRKDGSVVWILLNGSLVRDEEGGPLYFLAQVQDISGRKSAEERLRGAEERYRTLVERIPAVTFVDRADGSEEALYVSPQIEGMLGYTTEEWMEGRLWRERLHLDDRERVLASDERFEAEGEAVDEEYRLLAKDGSVVWVREETVLVRGEGGEPLYVQGIMSDVTEKKEAEERLEHQAFHDSLTGLPNRRLFMDRLGQALRRTRRRKKRSVAVLYMDLDGFKFINDSLGHDSGDRLLVEVARRLKGCLRPEDTLARFGGDEFVVLIEGAGAPDAAVRVAERITDELREPFALEGRELYAAASIGVGLGGGTRNPEQLLREADTAMYRAKDDGCSYCVFDPAMHDRAVNRLELENDFRRAIEENEFVVHYQPIVNLQTGAVWGMEALVRWEHPEWGLLNPDEFVPIAEESGLVVPMGELVLNEACRRAVEWQRGFPLTPPLAVSVNLSGRQLRRPDLHEVIGRALKESGLPASSLGLDITETVYIGALDANTAALDRLRALGIRISLDDFGSGYSSLSYLKRLPTDILKIDKSFTRGLGLEVEDTAIVQTVVDLAHILGMEVVAEGVETKEQETLLKEMGCDFAQGYLFSRPLPPEAVSEFLAN